MTIFVTVVPLHYALGRVSALQCSGHMIRALILSLSLFPLIASARGSHELCKPEPIYTHIYEADLDALGGCFEQDALLTVHRIKLSEDGWRQLTVQLKHFDFLTERETAGIQFLIAQATNVPDAFWVAFMKRVLPELSEHEFSSFGRFAKILLNRQRLHADLPPEIWLGLEAALLDEKTPMNAKLRLIAAFVDPTGGYSVSASFEVAMIDYLVSIRDYHHGTPYRTLLEDLAYEENLHASSVAHVKLLNERMTDGVLVKFLETRKHIRTEGDCEFSLLHKRMLLQREF